MGVRQPHNASQKARRIVKITVVMEDTRAVAGSTGTWEEWSTFICFYVEMVGGVEIWENERKEKSKKVEEGRVERVLFFCMEMFFGVIFLEGTEIRRDYLECCICVWGYIEAVGV